MKIIIIITILIFYDCVVQANYYADNQSSSYRELFAYTSDHDAKACIHDTFNYSNIRREQQQLVLLSNWSSAKRKPIEKPPIQREKPLRTTFTPKATACREWGKVFCKRLHDS